MKVTKVNERGDWSHPWTKELRQELEINNENEIVGEKLLLETDTIKVWSIHLPEGGRFPFHIHNKPYFYSAIDEGKSRSFYADGKVVDVEYRAKDITNFESLNEENFFIHNLVNIGETPLHFTTVEFKK